ncbi:MAG: DUF1801 domain-containing protein [Pikeienuella sp.]
MGPEISGWFKALDGEQRLIATELRALILSRDARLREALKWGQPCYTLNSMVCHIQKAKRHVSLGFARGAEMTGAAGLLAGDGARMRHVKIPLGGAVNRAGLAALIDEAIALDERG